MFECGMMETEKKRFLTKADLWLAFSILAAAFLFFLVFQINRAEGAYARISYNGTVILQISLSQTGGHYYLLTGQQPHRGMPEDSEASGSGSDGCAENPVNIREISQEELDAAASSDGAVDYNIILCQDGQVQMIQSSCPDKICLRHRAVSATGETIICLPHKVVIEIIGEEEHSLDAVVY